MYAAEAIYAAIQPLRVASRHRKYREGKECYSPAYELVIARYIRGFLLNPINRNPDALNSATTGQ